MIKDRKFRIALTKKSHYWFFHFYFRHYVIFRTADFHREMFRITENENVATAVIVAFRGSAKSTIFTLSYSLWSILGSQNKKLVVILSQTQRQARQHLINLKRELEKNIRLSRDLGPFREESDEWGGFSLVISNYGARISAASVEQSIRGIRHLQTRPDLIIADDVEDLQSVRTQEGRDKTYDFSGTFTSQAFNHTVETEPPLSKSPTGETEFTSYTEIETSDDTYYQSYNASGKIYHKFEMAITESTINYLDVSWEGHTSSVGNVSLWVWDYTLTNWSLLDSGIGMNDFTLSARISNLNNVRQGTGNITFLVQN